MLFRKFKKHFYFNLFIKLSLLLQVQPSQSFKKVLWENFQYIHIHSKGSIRQKILEKTTELHILNSRDLLRKKHLFERKRHPNCILDDINSCKGQGYEIGLVFKWDFFKNLTTPTIRHFKWNSVFNFLAKLFQLLLFKHKKGFLPNTQYINKFVD